MKKILELPSKGTLLNMKKIEIAEIVRKSIHVKVQTIETSDTKVFKSHQNEMLRRFQILLAQKLAEKDGVFEPRKINLSKN
jgi:hypothetical protein